MENEKLDQILNVVLELKTDVAELKSDVAVLKEKVTKLETDVAELKSNVSNLKARMNTLEKETKEMKQDINVLKVKAGTIATDVKENQTDIKTLVDYADKQEIEDTRQKYINDQYKEEQAIKTNALKDEVTEINERSRINQVKLEKLFSLEKPIMVNA